MDFSPKKSALLIGITSLIMFVLSFVISFSEIPNGVFIAGVNLSGMTQSEAETELQLINDEFKKSAIIFSVEDHDPIIVDRESLGLSIDVKSTVSRHARQVSLFAKLFTQDVQAFEPKKVDLKPEIAIDSQHLTEHLREVSRYETEPVDAHLTFVDGKWEVVSAKNGERLFPGELDRLKQAILTDPYIDSYTVRYIGLVPNTLEKDLISAQKQLNSFVDIPIEVHHGEEITQLIFNDTENPVPLLINGREIVFNEDQLGSWAEKYASERNQEAGSITVTGLEEFTSEYDHKTFNKATFEGSFESGWKINVDRLITDIKRILTTETDDRVVLVELDSVAPTVTSALDGMEFPDLLSSGRSSFVDSNHPDRVTNISLSIGAMDMLVIQPGEDLSMGRVTGWITPDKGYTKTKVLYGGAVGYGIGGGVCQSSTTIYRAALNGGFEILERRPHTLDVSYYHKYGHGLDAAVFTAMKRDFKFKNDTEHPILIHTYLTPYDEAVVEIYGTSDGRSVELNHIPTSVGRHKQWEWFVRWPGKEEKRIINTWYSK